MLYWRITDPDVDTAFLTGRFCMAKGEKEE